MNASPSRNEITGAHRPVADDVDGARVTTFEAVTGTATTTESGEADCGGSECGKAESSGLVHFENSLIGGEGNGTHRSLDDGIGNLCL